MTKSLKQIHTILKFIGVIHKLSLSEKEIEQVLEAMLTPGEIDVISQRIHVLQLLFSGTSQREVSEQLGVGVATATRGNRMLKENLELFERILKKGPF